MGVKGHWIRPRFVSHQVYSDHWNLAFGEKTEAPPESEPPATLPSVEAGKSVEDSERKDD